MKKILALLLALAMLTVLLAGCGSTQSSAPASASGSETASAAGSVQEAEEEQETAEVPAEASAEDASAVEPDAQEPVKYTGAVIPADECQAEGYDVKYGMFDFETYVELPITDTPETLTYWMMMQPFMMGYNNVTVGALLLALLLMAGIRERLDTCRLPKTMAGTPIALVMAGLMSLAFMAFKGMAQ